MEGENYSKNLELSEKELKDDKKMTELAKLATWRSVFESKYSNFVVLKDTVTKMFHLP